MKKEDNLSGGQTSEENKATDQKEDTTDISQQELDMLDNAGPVDEDDENLHRADLDGTDTDGTPLNEKASARDRSGRDLDVPGSEADNAMEDIGEEDEENNSYSLDDQ